MTKVVDNVAAEYEKKIAYILNKQKKESGNSNETLKTALAILKRFHENDIAYLESRINTAYIIYRYMLPEESAVAAILLYRDFKKNLLKRHTVIDEFGEIEGTAICDLMYDATKEWNDNVELAAKTADSFIMLCICDRMLKKLVKNLRRKGIPDTACISEAYKLAKENHMGQLRQTGEPYIVHPLKVAMILSDIGVESNIIAAAILHDVVEDTDVTIDDIREKFGEQIAKYVNAVTSVEKEYAVSSSIDEYSSDKTEMDFKSFEKLANSISRDPRMIFALYIKAADRIHNLQTIDEMNSIKKHNKADETDRMYLPLFKHFKLNYFSNIIEDLTWRATNLEQYNAIKTAYEEMYEINAFHISETKDYLQECLNTGFRTFSKMVGGDGDYDVEIHERRYSPLEIFNMVKDKTASYESEVKYVAKRYIPLCDFDIVFDSDNEKDTIGSYVTMFIKYYVDHVASTGRVITDYYSDQHGRFIINIEDRYRNNIRCCFSMNSDYITYRTGSTRGIYVAENDFDLAQTNEFIRVKLRNDREIELPKGASVIDVAFAIHEDIGITAKSAIINGKEAHVYHILHDGDKVIVNADTVKEDDELKQYIKHARISWLEYAKTPLARRKLIKFLSDRYEGDDPIRETKAQAKAVDSVSDNMMKNIDVNPKPRKENI